jgi:hypothetical protein
MIRGAESFLFAPTQNCFSVDSLLYPSIILSAPQDGVIAIIDEVYMVLISIHSCTMR